MNTPHFRQIIDHCLETLPDSISSRRGLLNALASVLPPSNEQRPAVLSLLAGLDRHLIEQREFPLQLPPTDSPLTPATTRRTTKGAK